MTFQFVAFSRTLSQKSAICAILLSACGIDRSALPGGRSEYAFWAMDRVQGVLNTTRGEREPDFFI
jgi:hypothetical protein